MNQPLGFAVGNALEVREAIGTLKGGGPADFREHCLEVAAHMLLLAGAARSIEAARRLAISHLEDGSATAKFRALIARQGGAAEVVDHPNLLPTAPLHAALRAARAGHVARANARIIGESAVALGAGRAKRGDPIDPAVGILMKVKIGDRVGVGDPLCEVHARTQVLLDQALQQLPSAFAISSRRVESLPLFYKTIRG